jgi:tRNA threonylcarbamoyladenosine modification (KEOPS) complex Cgi121 subunit
VPLQGYIDIHVACASYTESLQGFIDKVNQDGLYVAMVPLRLAREKGFEALLTAHLAAYTAYLRGAGIARRKGLDTLLYLAGTRNIRDVAAAYTPSGGEDVVLLAAGGTPPPPPSPSTCSIRHSSREAVTRAAVFPIEARVYRLPADQA